MLLNSRHDGILISCHVTRPEAGTTCKGIVQFAHGMCEHKERYIPFMEFLSRNGYVCIINDHRGHGESVLSGEDLGYFYSGGYEALVDDLLVVNEEIKKMYPGLPCCLFGHSMGSLAVRSYTKRHDDTIDGLIVCGSPSANPATGAGKMLTKLIASIKGDRHRPAIIQKMAFDGYNKKFSAEGLNAWLSTDKENVRIYNESPLCGYTFTANGFIGLFNLLQDTYSDKGWKVSKPGLPIHFIAGSGLFSNFNEIRFCACVCRAMASIQIRIAQPRLFLLFFMFQVDFDCFFIFNTTEVGNRVRVL